MTLSLKKQYCDVTICRKYFADFSQDSRMRGPSCGKSSDFVEPNLEARFLQRSDRNQRQERIETPKHDRIGHFERNFDFCRTKYPAPGEYRGAVAGPVEGGGGGGALKKDRHGDGSKESSCQGIFFAFSILHWHFGKVS